MAKFETESSKTMILESSKRRTNNTHRRILNTSIVFDTSRKIANTIVFDDENLRGGFAQIPNVVLYDPLLGVAAKLCYMLLLSYAWGAKSCFPSQKLLAENMASSISTITRALQELQRFKLVKVERLGQGKSNIYHIMKLSEGYLPKQYQDGPK